DHETVRDLESDPPNVDVDLPPGRLRHQCCDLERRGLAGLEIAHQIGEREARVDDVLDHEHVPALDVDVQVLEDADDAGAVLRGAAARDGHEIDLAGDRQMAHGGGHAEA